MLVPFKRNGKITIVNLSHNIPFCMCNVRHEALKVHLGDTITEHECIKILLVQGLGLGILQFYIITCYSQYLIMFVVVNMAHHHSAIIETLNMVNIIQKKSPYLHCVACT